ncbi:MAG: 2'-deoxycytidine 5'-triphosphate deaminase [Fimbriimonadaceae bacterium]|nr:2'-deoxycytidine 5'-triphosphate deaminase [Alphaproteobacteria bacterium]
MSAIAKADRPASLDQSAPQGILPYRDIHALVDAGHISIARPLADNQVQPASLDLRLGPTAFRVRASFLPGENASVRQKLDSLSLHEIDLANGAVLETGCVYIVPLIESLDLPGDIAAAANPKSSTGRLDIFTRVIADRAREFDKVEAGYCGPLYAEISPRTFPILAREGSRLSQIRFRRGAALCSDADLIELHEREMLVSGERPNIDHGLALSVDLSGTYRDRDKRDGLLGYRAKRHTGLVDVDRVGVYEVGDYWEPIYLQNNGGLILDPGQFYILASKEAVHVPPAYAAEMIPFNPLVGEFRVHYAGFFDPGFGHAAAGGTGSRAVLEVRSHEVPFILEDGQIIGRLIYEPLISPPEQVYGQGIGSNYQSQGLKLSKHFRVAKD